MISRLLETLLLNLIYGVRALCSALSERRQRKKPTVVSDTPDSSFAEVIRTAMDQMREPHAKPVGLNLRSEMFSRHGYLLGATGTGKTTLLLTIVEYCLKMQISIVVIDLRGELAHTILKMATALLPPEDIERGRVWFLDLEDDEHVMGFNPLVGEGDAQQRAGALHRDIKERSESWGVQLDETNHAALVALAELAEQDGETSLLDIAPLLKDDAYRREALERISDPYARSFFESYDPKQGYASAVLNKAAPLISHPALRNILATPPKATFSELLNERNGQVILVNLAVHRFHESAFILGSFLVSAFQNVFAARIRQPGSERRRTLFMIDEFENFGSARFAEIIAENRKLGAHLILAHQSLSQLDAKLRQILLENCGFQCYFQCGAHDADILSRQVMTQDPPAMARELLKRQKVGECHLNLRGEPTRRIRVRRVKEPEVSEEDVKKTRAAIWNCYAVPRAEVEARLRTRAEQRASATVSDPSTAQANTSSPRKTRRSSDTKATTAPSQETLEVREYAEERTSPRRKPGSPKGASS